MAKKKKICVIGAGLGGLAASIRLAVSGYEVDVYEKNSLPGGKAGVIEGGGFRFDTGPSLLTMPFVLEDLFNAAGEDISDFLPLKKLDVICKYYYSDGTAVKAYSDTAKFAEEINLKTDDSRESILRYLKYSEKIYDLTSELFLFSSFSEPKTFLNRKALKTLLQINKIDPFRTMHRANKKYFKDKKTIQLFDRYATYNGSNPFKAPATLNIIQHVEYNMGAYIPENGIFSISQSLLKLALKKGVNIYFGSDVKEIIHENKIVKGLRVAEEEIFYDTVVSNADVNYTFKNLLKDENSTTQKNLKKAEASSSAIVFYWGVNNVSPELEIHNILFSDNYKEEFDLLFGKKICPEDPTVYIYISSKYKTDDAPSGCENWFVMVNAPYNTNQNWEKEIYRMRKIIIDKVNKLLGKDIQNEIIFEKVMTPADIENKTSSSNGSIYGNSSNTKFAAFSRPQNKSKDYKKLYFCGGSAHPGGGIPLVLLSGKITSQLINKYEND